ncbi:MAG: FKBP-type peptidyl-prolyl cis-trans isomerase 2 [Saprospiraceae bacterium]|jgi:FKBP-type peptidyl-prolyl cis-trans isomerase 2
MTQEVKLNDNIKVHYTGKIESGEVFDSSLERDPLTFKVGEGTLLKGFEHAVIGMKINDSKEIKIPCGEGYGTVREDLIAKVDKKNLSKEIEPTVGMELTSKYPDGTDVVVRIVDVSEQEVTVDANHPLAGMDLTFEITLVSIKN